MKVKQPEISLEHIDGLASEIAELHGEPLGEIGHPWAISGGLSVHDRLAQVNTGEETGIGLFFTASDNWAIRTIDIEDAKSGGIYIQERIFRRHEDELSVENESSLGYKNEHGGGPRSRIRAFLALTCLKEQLELPEQT